MTTYRVSGKLADEQYNAVLQVYPRTVNLIDAQGNRFQFSRKRGAQMLRAWRKFNLSIVKE